jgi:hypothetical protein
MTPRTPQCEVFWALLSSSKHSGVPEDSKSSLFFQVLGFTPTLGQSRVATTYNTPYINHVLYNKTWFMNKEKKKKRKIQNTFQVKLPHLHIFNMPKK